MNNDPITFHDTGRWVTKWFSFKDIDGNQHLSGEYWEIGYQVGVGVLLANDDQPRSPRFFVEKSGIEAFVGKGDNGGFKWWILLLAAVIGYLVLKRK